MLACMALCTVEAHAQKTANSSGGNLSGTGGNAAQSLGNVFYREITGNTGSAIPGTQVPYVITSTLGTAQGSVSLEPAAYPNPVTDVLHLRIDSPSTVPYTYELYDAKGSLLQAKDTAGEVTAVNMSAYPSGVYGLSVRKNRQIIKTFRIIKK